MAEQNQNERYKDKKYDDLIKLRDEYVEGGNNAQTKYDRTIASFSGGIYGLSLLTITLLLSHSQKILYVEYIVAAWWFFAVSIVSITASHFFSERAYRNAVDQMNKNNKNKQETAPEEGQAVNKPEDVPKSTRKKMKFASDIIKALNILSGMFFIAGIVFFLLFASCNILSLS